MRPSVLFKMYNMYIYIITVIRMNPISHSDHILALLWSTSNYHAKKKQALRPGKVSTFELRLLQL